MSTAALPSAPPCSDRILRIFLSRGVRPHRLGIGVAVGWLLLVGLIHLLAEVFVGPMPLPFGPVRFAWTAVVNAGLVGLMLGAHAHLHLGALSDLARLRPILPGDDAAVAARQREVPNLSAGARLAAVLLGTAGGLAIANLDPTLSQLYRDYSSFDPRYVLFVAQNVLFGVLGSRLFAAEVHMTRAYARLGESVEVDLIDPSRLTVFAQKGLRSVLVWVLIFSLYSMFWLLDAAGEANVLLPVLLLALVAVALVAPTRGAHRSLVAAKHAELARVGEMIRAESARCLSPRRPGDVPEDARLGNLLQYHAFLKSLREWPFDVSIVTRSILLVFLGAGSWLGGAIVERLLGLLLD